MKPARHLALAAILSLCAAPLLAQDGMPIEADATKTLLDSLTRYNPEFAGESHYGVYLQGAKSIGMMKITVARAPAESAAAIYRCEMALDLKFGDSKISENEVALLQADFSLVSRSSVESNQEGENKTTENATVTIEDGHFVCKKSQDEREETFKLPVKGPNHESFVSTTLLVRSIDVAKPGTYAFKEMVWPELADEGGPQEEAKTRNVVITVPAVSEYEHRGKKLQAYQLTAKRDGETEMVFVVDANHRLLAFWPGDAPIKMILSAVATEARKDLEKAENVEASAKTPKGACAVYVLVLAKSKPTSALNAVMDWTALHAWLTTVNPGRWENTPVDEFADTLRGEFDALPAQFTKQVAKQFISLLATKNTGDDAAEVNGPGLPSPFKLKKQADGSWKIVQFPTG